MQITEFHVSTYIELYLKLRTAADRLKQSKRDSIKAYAQQIGQTHAEGDLDMKDFIMQHAIDAGFNPNWLKPKKKSTQKIEMENDKQRLADLFKEKEDAVLTLEDLFSADEQEPQQELQQLEDAPPPGPTVTKEKSAGLQAQLSQAK